MEITITGSSGYLGKDLITSLTKEDNKINLEWKCYTKIPFPSMILDLNIRT